MNRKKWLGLFLLLMFLYAFSVAFTVKKSTKQPASFAFPFYSTGTIVKHSYYQLQLATEQKQARWVAYKMYPFYLVKKVSRTNQFCLDPLHKDSTATLLDYKNSGYDRGHLMPAGDMSFDETAMKESFYITNISPQKPGFNRGKWKQLEEWVRQEVVTSDSMLVVTGPVFKNSKEFIGKNEVPVPAAFYKVLVKFKQKKVCGIGFLMNNEKLTGDLQVYAVKITDVERETGIDFNKNWNNKIEKVIENELVKNDWHF